MRMHPQAGSNIIKPFRFEYSIAEIVNPQLESLDGASYSPGLSSSDIQLATRIISAFDIVVAPSRAP